MKQDLNIVSGNKLNTALTIFFVPYVVFEIPSNILMKKFQPHVWCLLFPILNLALHFANGGSIGLHVFVRRRHDVSGLH